MRGKSKIPACQGQILAEGIGQDLTDLEWTKATFELDRTKRNPGIFVFTFLSYGFNVTMNILNANNIPEITKITPANEHGHISEFLALSGRE